MKLAPLAAAAVLFLAGCGHLDVTPAGNPQRVLNGSVRAPSTLPAGAEIVVRIIDTSPAESLATRPKRDLPVADRLPPPPDRRFLGEHRQTLAVATLDPVPFRVEYEADDDELRHGLNVDVRISYDGRVRFHTISAHIITLASSPFPQEVAVQAVQ